MNPINRGVNCARSPSLADVRQNRRVAWYRCPIDRDTLRELTTPDDRRGLFLAVGHLSLWCLTGVIAYACFTYQLWIGFFVALFCHGTVASFFTAPHHELCHTTVFKTKWLNGFFLRVYALFGWLNFHVYKFSHSYHHRFTLFVEGDREEILPVKPSLRWSYLLQLFTVNITGGYQSRGVIPTLKNFFELALNRFDNPFNSWGDELYQDHPRERRQAANWARLVLAFHALVIGGSFWIGQPVFALLVSGSVFIANWWRYFVGVPMHCGLRSEIADFRKCVRTITLDPISEFLYWHMNWHLEHHMYAAVPCYRLKQLHQTVAADMPAPRTLIGAWREMRQTWQRQQSDPSYQFDTPLPAAVPGQPADDRASDSLAASMGGLAPAVLDRNVHSNNRVQVKPNASREPAFGDQTDLSVVERNRVGP